MSKTKPRGESTPMQNTDEPPVPSYGLLYITRAYNRGEITFEEWMKRSKEWAERVIRQLGTQA